MYYNHTIIFYLNNNFIKAEAHKEEYSIEKESYTKTYTDNNEIEATLLAFNCNVVLNKNIDNVLDIIHEYIELGDD